MRGWCNLCGKRLDERELRHYGTLCMDHRPMCVPQKGRSFWAFGADGAYMSPGPAPRFILEGDFVSLRAR